jgi:hypothetical protein
MKHLAGLIDQAVMALAVTGQIAAWLSGLQVVVPPMMYERAEEHICWLWEKDCLEPWTKNAFCGMISSSR